MGDKKAYVFVTNNYNGYVGIVAAVQEIEVNLWLKDKYGRTNTTCRKRTGEAWIEAKNVSARKRLRLERKCMFVGSKDTSTGTSKLCYIAVGQISN